MTAESLFLPGLMCEGQFIVGTSAEQRKER